MTQLSPWKIDKARLTAIGDFDKMAAESNAPYLLVGATARDVVDSLIGISSRRMTQDIDLAVYVADWDEFGRLCSVMVTSGKFRKSEVPQHRYIHIPTGMRVDVLPFGPIAGPEKTIEWPAPDFSVMSTVGFEEAYNAALAIEISVNPIITIKVSSRPGLAIMKLIAWGNERAGRARDAQDLLHLILYYLDQDNIERLYREHLDLVEVEEFDFECAAARFLGRDLAAISNPQTLTEIDRILTLETKVDSDYQLVNDMIGGGAEKEYYSEKAFLLLQNLKYGVQDIIIKRNR